MVRDAFDEIRDDARAEGEAKGRAEGEAKGRAEGITNSLSALMKSMKWGIDQAMDALQIPLDQRAKYAELIAQQNG